MADNKKAENKKPEKEIKEEKKAVKEDSKATKEESKSVKTGKAAAVSKKANSKKENPVKDEKIDSKKKSALSDKKYIIAMILAVVALFGVAGFILFRTFNNNAPTIVPTASDTVHYVTDENGVAITDSNGVAVTMNKEMIYVEVTDKNGNPIKDKDGNVVTTAIYKEFDVTVNVPVTNAAGETVTDGAGNVVTTQEVLHQNPNEQNGALVLGTTIVPVYDGNGQTGVDQNGEVITQVIELTSNPIQVEPASLQWKTSLGGTQADYFSSIALASDGNYIASNITNSKDGNMTEFKSLGYQTPYTVLVKYDDNGNVIWKKALGSSKGNFEITDVITNPDGTFYGVGYGKNVGGKTGKGYYDGFVAKYDANGNQLWINVFGTSTVDYFYNGFRASDGGIIAVGSVGSNDKDAAGFNKPANQSAACIVKYNADGTLVFKNVVGGNGDVFYDVAQSKDGGIFVIGRFTSGTLFKCLGQTDSGIVKFTADGKMETASAIAGTGNDLFSGITACKDGGVVVVGRSNSNDDGVADSMFQGSLASRGGYDAYIIKYEENLTIAFANPFRGQNDDDLIDIIEKSDGTFVAVGCSDSSTRDLKGITTRGGDDIVIAAFDKRGSLIWARSFGGTLDESSDAICLASDGGYCVAGRTLSKNIDMYGIAQYVNGKSIGVIAKFPQ